MDIFKIEGIVLFIGTFLALALAFILWFKGKSRATFHFGWAAFFGSIYIFNFWGFIFFEHNKLFWIKNCWFGMLIIPAYLIFTYYFTGRIKYIRLKSFLWYLSGITITYFALTTSYFTAGISSEYPFKDIQGPLDPLARVYIFVGLIIGLFYLTKAYFKSTGFKKWQLKYFILGVTIHIGGGIFEGVISPSFWPIPTAISGIILSFTTILGTGLITYAIFKKGALGIRVILTEILVGAIGVILLIQTLLAENQPAKILGFITLAAFLFVGYLLIRITQKEIKRKEQAEGLSKQLRQLNETLEDRIKQRTKELEKSYQEIKKRKDELEKFYGLTVGRELKMVELKKEIKELKSKLGEK